MALLGSGHKASRARWTIRSWHKGANNSPQRDGRADDHHRTHRRPVIHRRRPHPSVQNALRAHCFSDRWRLGSRSPRLVHWRACIPFRAGCRQTASRGASTNNAVTESICREATQSDTCRGLGLTSLHPRMCRRAAMQGSPPANYC